MPADAADALRHLRMRLGREPSLVELLTQLGVEPSGTPASPRIASDVEMSAELQAQDLMRQNPEIARLREKLIRELLFGTRELGHLHGSDFLGDPEAPRPTSPFTPAEKPVARPPFGS